VISSDKAELGEAMLAIEPGSGIKRKGRWWEKVIRELAIQLERWSMLTALKARRWQRRDDFE
jgi:hypothetical protein